MHFRVKNTLKNNFNHTLKHDMIPQSGSSTEQQILPFFTVEIWEKMYPKCLPMWCLWRKQMESGENV
jgi:hypothetical protein